MLTRVLTAATLLPIVAIIYFGPAWSFWLLATAASLKMAQETLRLFEHAGASPLRAPVLVGVVLIDAAFLVPRHLPVEAALALAGVACFGAWMLLRARVDGALTGLGAMLATLLYPSLLMGFQIALRGLDPEAGRQSTARLVFLYAAVFGGDAAAYFGGRLLGRTQLAPLISPKKTVEGFLAGIAGGIALGCVFAALLPVGLPMGMAALLSGILAVAGAFGDLTKSLLKRSADVKDSGSLLPGHGGILDRLDGLLVSSPVFWLILTSPAFRGAAAR